MSPLKAWLTWVYCLDVMHKRSFIIYYLDEGGGGHFDFLMAKNCNCFIEKRVRPNIFGEQSTPPPTREDLLAF